MPDLTLTVTNPDGTMEWRDFPATSQAVRMEPGRAQWLADHSLLLPDGSIQPGVYTAEHLAPNINRPNLDWQIEKMLAVGQSKAWVRRLVENALVLAISNRANTGLTEDEVEAGGRRWRSVIDKWPYGQALDPIPPLATAYHEAPAQALTEARVREIVRDEIAKAK